MCFIMEKNNTLLTYFINQVNNYEKVFLIQMYYIHLYIIVHISPH